MSCFDEVKEALKDFDEKVIKEIVEDLEREQTRLFKEGVHNPGIQLEIMAQKRINEFLKYVQESRALKARNIFKRNQRRTNQKAFSQRYKGREKESILKDLRGTNFQWGGGRVGAQEIGNTIRGQLKGELITSLKDNGVFDFYRKGLLQKEVAQELFELDNPTGKAGVSGSVDAQKIAKSIREVQSSILRNYKDSGILINEISNYIIRQSHDSDKLLSKGFDAWRDGIIEKLDHDKTFRGAEDIDKFLEDAYDNIVSGNHRQISGVQDSDQLIKAVGTSASISTRLNRQRVLHFKDGASFYDYNLDFGRGNIFESFDASINVSSRHIGLSHKFGPNPRAAVELDIKNLGISAADADGIMKEFNNIDGSLEFASTKNGAIVRKVGAGARATQVVSKLGLATLSSVTDLAGLATNLKLQTGENYLGAALGSVVRGISGFTGKVTGVGKNTDIVREIGLAVDDMNGALMRKFGADDSGTPGILSKLAQLEMRINGLQPWTDSLKETSIIRSSEILAREAKGSFDGLSKEIKREIGGYGINDTDWKIIQKSIEESEGRSFVTLEGIRAVDQEFAKNTLLESGRIPKEASAAFAASEVKRFREDVARKVSTFYTNNADSAVVTPGARERAIINQGTRSDTIFGQVMRTVGLFKTFPITVLTKQVERIALSGGADSVLKGIRSREGGLLLAQHMAAMTALAYVGWSLKNMVQNKTPPDANDPKVWAEAMLRGGSLGLYGDLILGDFNSRAGRGVVKTLAGPVFGQFDDAFDLYSAMKDPERNVKASKAFNLLLKNMPFQNTIGLRAGMDYLFLYNIQESLNPGYTRRLERFVEDKGEGHLFYQPSERR